MTDIYVTFLRSGSSVLYVGTSLDDAKATADKFDREHHNYKYPVDWDEDWVPRRDYEPPNLVETLYAISYVVQRFEVTL